MIRVDANGATVDEQTAGHHFSRKYDAKYSAVAKLEIGCRGADAPRFAGIIQRLAHSSARGDGRIFAADVHDAINLRTGTVGETAL